MSTHVMMLLSMNEVTRTAYYNARKEKDKVFGEKPNGFCFLRDKKTARYDLYLTVDGKFFVGDMQDYSFNDFVNMKLREVRTEYTAIFEAPDISANDKGAA